MGVSTQSTWARRDLLARRSNFGRRRAQSPFVRARWTRDAPASTQLQLMSSSLSRKRSRSDIVDALPGDLKMLLNVPASVVGACLQSVEVLVAEEASEALRVSE